MRITEVEMINLFVKKAKRYIADLDDVGLEYDLRQINIDEQGPVCSDHHLLQIFREATYHKIDDNTLYGLIEKICMEYCMSFL